MCKPLLVLNWLIFLLLMYVMDFNHFLGIFYSNKVGDQIRLDYIDYVTTSGGLSGMVATTPMGMLVYAIRASRGIVIAAAFIFACQ